MKKLVSATLISSLVLASCGGDTSEDEETTDDTETTEETQDNSEDTSDNGNSDSSEDDASDNSDSDNSEGDSSDNSDSDNSEGDSSDNGDSDSSEDDTSDNGDSGSSDSDSSDSEGSGFGGLFGNDDDEDSDSSSNESDDDSTDSSSNGSDDDSTDSSNNESDGDSSDNDSDSSSGALFGNDDDEGTSEPDDDLIEEDLDVSDLENSSEGDIVEGDHSVTFLISSNPELIEVINEAEETDLTIDDVLMPADDVTTYNAHTYLGVFGFLNENPEPEFYDVVGLRGAVDEREGLKLYAEQYDLETGQSVPYAYGDSLTNEMYMNENGQWHDIQGEADPEEIMYGTYSNIEEILRDDLSDLLEVRETDDYFILYYLGEDEGIYDSLGELFSVEFTNANMGEMTTGVFGIVNKESTEFEHLSYITHAPGINPEEFLQIDLALDFLDYGEYDIGLPRPEGLELE